MWLEEMCPEVFQPSGLLQIAKQTCRHAQRMANRLETLLQSPRLSFSAPH